MSFFVISTFCRGSRTEMQHTLNELKVMSLFKKNKIQFG